MSTPTSARPSENSSSWHLGDPTCNFAIQQLSTHVLNPTIESKRAVKQLTRYLKGTQHICLRLEPCQMVQKGLQELVGRSDSDWVVTQIGLAIRQHAKVSRDIIAMCRT